MNNKSTHDIGNRSKPMASLNYFEYLPWALPLQTDNIHYVEKKENESENTETKSE